MALLDLLGRRWTLRVLWELRLGPLTFVASRRAAGGLSQSVLALRLSELRAAGLVEASEPASYRLTAAGQELVAEIGRIDRWADARAAGPARRVVPRLTARGRRDVTDVRNQHPAPRSSSRRRSGGLVAGQASRNRRRPAVPGLTVQDRASAFGPGAPPGTRRPAATGVGARATTDSGARPSVRVRV